MVADTVSYVLVGTGAKDPKVEANLNGPTRRLENLRFCHNKVNLSHSKETDRERDDLAELYKPTLTSIPLVREPPSGRWVVQVPVSYDRLVRCR